MSVFEVGRLCVKLAGRDAGQKCVVVEKFDNTYVLIDGATRRKKVNVKHLEPLSETVEIKDKASHDDVRAAFQKLGLPTWDKKSKKPTERQKKQKKQKEKKVTKKESKKEEKKLEKKEAPKEEVKEVPKKEEKKE